MVENTGFFKDKTVFISGGSRGIGLAIVKKIATDGANIVIAAKTSDPHPKLPGTIWTAAKEIENLGGKCLPCLMDVRNENSIDEAVKKTVKHFGGIDISKYGMSMVALGLSEEFKQHGVAVNTLWPRTSILTSATKITNTSENAWRQCRKEEILADAAYLLLSKSSKEFTGKFTIDDEILAEAGITDLKQYSYDSSSKLITSFFIPGVQYTNPRAKI